MVEGLSSCLTDAYSRGMKYYTIRRVTRLCRRSCSIITEKKILSQRKCVFARFHIQTVNAVGSAGESGSTNFDIVKKASPARNNFRKNLLNHSVNVRIKFVSQMKFAH